MPLVACGKVDQRMFQLSLRYEIVAYRTLITAIDALDRSSLTRGISAANG